MKLKCPKDQASINIGGTEYTGVDGTVDILDPIHVAAALDNGFVEVPAPTASPRKQPGE